jgi:hypothetical protein
MCSQIYVNILLKYFRLRKDLDTGKQIEVGISCYIYVYINMSINLDVYEVTSNSTQQNRPKKYEG